MSAPAPQLRTPVPGRRQPRSPIPQTPAARPRTSSPPSPRRRARRGSTPAFWVVTFLIVTTMVVGIVSVSALLVRSSFHEEELRERIGALRVEQEGLHRDVVDLSSPSRIHAWARAEGMVVPERVITLRVANDRPTGTGPAA